MGGTAILWVEPRDYTLQDASAATGNGTPARLAGRYGALTVQVVGSGWTGAVTFKATQDGTHYVTIEGLNVNDGSKAASTTSDGVFLFNVSGIRAFMADHTWTAGSVTVTGTAQALSPGNLADVQLSAADIEIGAVEIKNATDDTRATVGANGVHVDVRALPSGTVAGSSSLPAGTNNIGDVDVASIAAGANVIGKVGIDQTTPGTTNGIQVVAALPTGTNNIGDVDVLTLPAGTVAGSASLPAGANNIGDVDIASMPAEWTVTGTSSANATVTVSKAGVGGQKHVITGYLVVIRGAAAGADIGVALKDNTTVKISDYIGNAAPRGTRVGITGLNIEMTTNTQANLAVDAGGASVICEATFWGYTK